MVMGEELLPRAWVGCLACYNAGRLVGDWYDATSVPLDVSEVVWTASMGSPEPDHATHDELWVFDHEGFGGLLAGECSPADAAALGRLLDELGEDAAAYAAYAEWVGVRDASVDEFREAFNGVWDSEMAYAEGLADELGVVVPDVWPLSHIDWVAATRDLFLTDYRSSPAPDGRVYVFRMW